MLGVPLEGSSRKIRFTPMASSRSVNQPFGLSQVLVCTTEDDIIKKEAIETVNGTSDCMRKSHLH